MPIITLSVPEDLKRDMDRFRDINWSEVARVAIREKVSKLKILEQITVKSTLTDADAIALGKKINSSLHKLYDGA